MSGPLHRQKGVPTPQPNAATTADVTPTLAGAVLAMPAGSALDEHVQRSLERLGHPCNSAKLSTSWQGAQQLIAQLTAMGHQVELQICQDRCHCRILRVLRGNALAKQLASAEAAQLPEAVAKAALLTFLEMEPPAPSSR